jgi:hypothetical protein
MAFIKKQLSHCPTIIYFGLMLPREVLGIKAQGKGEYIYTRKKSTKVMPFERKIFKFL